MIAVFSRSAALIGEILYERTKDLSIDSIGGLEVGAVPMTTAAVISYHSHGREMEGFWVRDKAKGHGTQKLIEGNLKPRSRVAVVDDVVTRGSSVIRAIDEVQKLGCEVVLVLALVDRLRGAEALFLKRGSRTIGRSSRSEIWGSMSMYLDRLKSLLSEGGITPGNTPRLAQV